MVKIIPNLASVQGTVKSIGENSALQGYSQVEFDLQKADDIEGVNNLAKADEGSVIRINVKPEQIIGYNIKPGNNLSLKARKEFGQVYFIE